MFRTVGLQVFALIAAADLASAGVVIVGSYTGAKTPKGRTVEFRIQDGRGRITSQPGQYIYYDHGTRTAFIVDTDKKTSFKMDEARAKQIAAQLAEAQKTVEAKLKELPPDKRAMVEKMMKEQGGGPRPDGQRKPLDFLEVGSDKVGPWACERYRASGDGRKVEVCTAEADALNIPPDDVAVFEGFLDLSERMAGESGAGGGKAADRGYEGLPLERKEMRADGVVTDRFVIESITLESVPADELRPPSGLKEVTPPGPPPPSR